MNGHLKNDYVPNFVTYSFLDKVDCPDMTDRSWCSDELFEEEVDLGYNRVDDLMSLVCAIDTDLADDEDDDSDLAAEPSQL